MWKEKGMSKKNKKIRNECHHLSLRGINGSFPQPVIIVLSYGLLRILPYGYRVIESALK